MSTISNDSDIQLEQIKNNSKSSEFSAKFYEKIKTFLERDKYNLFKLKKNLNIDEKINITNSEIQKMINLKMKIDSEIEQLKENRNSLKKKNLDLFKKLVVKLGMKNEN